MIQHSQTRANGLTRTHSLPWNRKRYNIQLRHPVTKSSSREQPRCAAIAIGKFVEHRRHHRREKRDSSYQEKGLEKGLGMEAMAALARQLTTKHVTGVWAVSV